MKRHLGWFAAVSTLMTLLVGCSDHSSPVMPSSQSPEPARLLSSVAGPDVVPDQYIVVMKPSVADVHSAVDDLSRRQNFAARYRYTNTIKGFSAKLSAQQLEALRQDPRIAYIEQDQIVRIVTTQTNPPSWGLDRIDQRPLPLDATYTYNQNGASVDAYILDTGIRQDHVDFGGRAIAGYDAITPGGSANDAHGHGTHVAGTVGGTTYGIAKGVRLIAVRVLDANGSGTYSTVIAGVDWVTGHHTTRLAVANMSLGGPASASLDDAVRRSIADGVTYCVAAGNSTADASTQSPADVTEAITVGATDRYDAFAYFSNYGSVVDLSAPGVSITSAYYSSSTAIATMSGTSMASPHAAGAAALYLEADPTSTPSQVQAGLVASATSGVITNLRTGTANRLLYSVPGSSTPLSPPGTPTLVSPAGGATGVAMPVAVTWSGVTGASTYRVQVSPSADFASLASDKPGLMTTSGSVSGLAAGSVYYWRVNATNSAGTSNWSSVRSFTTAVTVGAPPSAPTLVSPTSGTNNASRTATTLRWNTSAGAASYRVQISTSSTFTTLVVDRSGLTSTSTTVSGLGRHVFYYWRVNATNANGTSAWSAVWRFRTGN